MQALDSPDVHVFGELLALPSVKAVSNVCPPLGDTAPPSPVNIRLFDIHSRVQLQRAVDARHSSTTF